MYTYIDAYMNGCIYGLVLNPQENTQIAFFGLERIRKPCAGRAFSESARAAAQALASACFRSFVADLGMRQL